MALLYRIGKTKYQYPLLLFIFSRIALFMLPVFLIGLWPSRSHPNFWEVFSQWDGKWYLGIVKEGYWFGGADAQSPVAFFPLYPFLGKLLSLFSIPPHISLFFISNAFALGFFVLFWKLIKEEMGDKIANRSLFYYAIFPLSFFLSALYTESLFLFLSCSVFYLIKRGDFLKAAIFVGLAGATRLMGILLFLPMLYAYLRKKDGDFFRLATLALISFSGLGIYSLFCYLNFGRWFPFFEVVQGAWHRVLLPPWSVINILIQSLLIIRPPSPFFPILIFDMTIIATSAFLIIYVIKKSLLNWSYSLYAGTYFFLIITQVWDPRFFLPSGSMGRYLFVLFPLFMVLGYLGEKFNWFNLLITFIFISMWGPFALAFFHGLWIE